MKEHKDHQEYTKNTTLYYGGRPGLSAVLDILCYISPEVLLSKDRKLMVYSKARLSSVS